MNTHEITFAQPPTDYRTDVPELLDIAHTIVERDVDLIDLFLAGSLPETLPMDWPERDPLHGIDLDVIAEYEKRMDELREARRGRIGYELEFDCDPDYDY